MAAPHRLKERDEAKMRPELSKIRREDTYDFAKLNRDFVG
jgi:hypothetical protein